MSEEVIAKLKGLLAEYGLNVIGAVLLLVIGRIVAKLIARLIRRVMTQSKVDETLTAFAGNLAYVILMAFVVLAALAKIGVQTTSFIAVLGAAGLAIGLALQGSLANFAAGVLMLIFRPFKVGDFIDTAGTSGIVEEINIFTTQLRTPDNKTIVVPNAKIGSDNITNFSAKDTRRIDLVIGVGYGDDLNKVSKVLQELLADDERILKDPAPTVAVLELADSSVNFAVRPWTRLETYWDVYFDLVKTIKERFDAEDISIPFPQRDLHLDGAVVQKAA